MAATRVYHWKHGWIPLDHQAALSKAKGNTARADELLNAQLQPVTQAHLPRASHITAAFNPHSRRFVIHDKETGGRVSISESQGHSVHESGRPITRVNGTSIDHPAFVMSGRPEGGAPYKNPRDLDRAAQEREDAAHLARVNAEAKQVASTASDRQVSYARDLLFRRKRNGDEGGFVDTKGLVKPDGTVDQDRLKKMTKRQISALIDSLRGNY